MSLTIEEMSLQHSMAMSAQAERRRTELGQDSFLRLMTEQLKHQDPLKPLDNAEFVSQMAAFSTVKGIGDLNGAFNQVAGALAANQGLQGTSLLGHNALIPADRATVNSDEGISGAVWAEGPGSVVVEITDAGGQLVRRVEVAASGPGDVDWHWDGTNSAGAPAANGEYTFKATYVSNTGTSTAAIPMLLGRIESVMLSPDGLILNLAGIGSIPLAGVRRIG